MTVLDDFEDAVATNSYTHGRLNRLSLHTHVQEILKLSRDRTQFNTQVNKFNQGLSIQN